jgi:hypothetical protein
MKRTYIIISPTHVSCALDINSNSIHLFQIRKLHMVLFKLEMIQANNKLFYTEKNYTTKSNTIKLP